MFEWIDLDAPAFVQVMDLAAVICVFLAAVLSAAAGIGLLRFSDALSRLHAATKPQIFGLLLVIAAVAFDQRSLATLLGLIPVFVFQSLTAPIAAHMVGRAAYRAGQLDNSKLMIDELGPAIERSDLQDAALAGAGHVTQPEATQPEATQPDVAMTETTQPDSAVHERETE